MTTVAIGQQVPDIELPATEGKSIKLSDFRGKHLVLFFYPKANTPGCTQEAHDFRDAINRFRRDSAARVTEFHQDLLSDPEERLCEAFDVIRMKNMYGKRVRGIERSTFLIDREGILRREWRKVKVNQHADEVLEAVTTLDA